MRSYRSLFERYSTADRGEIARTFARAALGEGSERTFTAHPFGGERPFARTPVRTNTCSGVQVFGGGGGGFDIGVDIEENLYYIII